MGLVPEMDTGVRFVHQPVKRFVQRHSEDGMNPGHRATQDPECRRSGDLAESQPVPVLGFSCNPASQCSLDDLIG